MAGKVPIVIEVDVQPMAWFNFKTMAEFNANMNLSGEFEFRQTFEVDVDGGSFEATKPVFPRDPIQMDKLNVEGNFHAKAEMKVGPRMTFTVNKVSISQDIAPKITASTDLTVSIDAFTKQACATGESKIEAGLDFRTGISLPVLNPFSAAKDMCASTMGVALDIMGGFVDTAENCINAGVNFMAERVGCFAGAIGINTKIGDNEGGKN